MTLQEQINIASAGATIALPDGSEHVGNFVINKPLTITGKAKLRSPNPDPAIFIPPKTGPVALNGPEVTQTGMIYDLIRVGEWQTTALADVPAGLSIENCDIHGLPDQESQRGISANCANFTIKNSKVREIHGKGYDTQAICAWNGPGPFKILDCYLEAAGENVMFGGADARVPNLVPSDIEIRRCKIVKPMSWKGVWTAKNLLELKSARRVTIDGNILENSWVDGQMGWGVLFTCRNQEGTNPWAVVEDVAFTNNSLLNVAGGFQLLGSDYNFPSLQSSRLRIANNIIRLAQDGSLGNNGRLIQVQQFNQVTFERNDGNPPQTCLMITGADSAGIVTPSHGLVYQNNLVSHGEYGFFGDGGKPVTYYAPDSKVVGNVVYGVHSQQLPGNTYLPTKPEPVPSGVGVDIAALLAAQAGTIVVPPPPPVPEYRDVSFTKDTESLRTALYQKQYGEGYAAWSELPGNKIKFRKF